MCLQHQLWYQMAVDRMGWDKRRRIKVWELVLAGLEYASRERLARGRQHRLHVVGSMGGVQTDHGD